jgi:hypothetical protein
MHKPGIINFQSLAPEIGKTIIVADLRDMIPFEVKRMYWINYQSNQTTITEHANKSQHQVIIPMTGGVEITLEDTNHNSQKYWLEDNCQGLLVPPMFWKKLTYTPNLLLLCFASDVYNKDDYIRSYEDFCAINMGV